MIVQLLDSLKAWVKGQPAYYAARRRLVELATRHIAGPTDSASAEDDLVVVCLVRNGELFVRSFIEHYIALGARQIVLLVNRPSDRTVEIARRYQQVTILRCDLPFKRFQFDMREAMVRRYGRRGWVLYADIDEHFHYPHADRLPIHELLRYLNRHGYTAVVAQMLDMFSGDALQAHRSSVDDRLADFYQFYDLSALEKYEYSSRYAGKNTASNPAIKIHMGGIRKLLFGAECLLIKHPLMRMTPDMVAFDGTTHDIRNARVADFSCVLLHYKFISALPEQTVSAIREGQYWQGSAEYRLYHKVLEHNPNLGIRQPSSLQLRTADDLIEQGFMVVSPAYEDWVQHGQQR